MHKVFVLIFFILIAINVIQLTTQVIHHQQHSKDLQLHNLGDQFKGLEQIFNKMPKVGYYTDKDLNNTLAIAQFEQAQYHLAPTVLDLNHTDYPVVIFDCTTAQIAMEKIKELGMTPVKASNFGVIIAINPKAQGLQP